MNSVQPQSATWCSSPRLISVIMHTREDVFIRKAVFVLPKKTAPDITIGFENSTPSVAVTLCRVSESGRMSVCISGEVGRRTMQKLDSALEKCLRSVCVLALIALSFFGSE